MQTLCTYMEQVLKAYPNSFEVRKLIGCIAHKNGDQSKALQHLNHIVEVFPHDRIDEEVWGDLGALYVTRCCVYAWTDTHTRTFKYRERYT